MFTQSFPDTVHCGSFRLYIDSSPSAHNSVIPCQSVINLESSIQIGQQVLNVNLVIKYLLCPWILLEHMSCTTSLQRILPWAILSSRCQLSPVCLPQCLTLFRLPWWFHVKACVVMSLFGFHKVWKAIPRMSIPVFPKYFAGTD